MDLEHPEDLGALDVASYAAKKIGGRVLNGVVDRHFGFGVDVAETLGMVNGALVPIVKDAYAAHPGETRVETWGRRVKWTGGIAAGITVFAGAAYLGWRFLGQAAKSEDE